MELEERVNMLRYKAIQELKYYNSACDKGEKAAILLGKERLDAYVHSYAIMIGTDYDQAFKELCDKPSKARNELQ